MAEAPRVRLGKWTAASSRLTLKAEQIIEEASAAKGAGELFVFVVALFFPEISAVAIDFVRPEQVFVPLYFS